MLKRSIILLCMCVLIGVTYGQSKCEKQLAHAIDKLITGMEDANLELLSTVVSPRVSYGHSSGKVEDRESFFNALKTGASDFVKITISDQHIDFFKKTAIVRHMLDATTNDNQKPGTVKLKIVTIWKKMHGRWMMIARQAVKPPVEK